MLKLFIDGSQGTTGLKIYERIKNRKACELIILPEEERKSEAARSEAIGKSDIVLICLPDEAARKSVEFAKSAGVRVIDASTAHRCDDEFTYGFPELNLYERIKDSSLVAVPGCHASGFLALTVPILNEGIIDENADVSFFSVTGYSGGGKPMIAEYETQPRGEKYKAPRCYALAQKHKHLAEIKHITSLTPIFNPIVADFYSGMLVCVPLYAGMLRKNISPDKLRDIYMSYYKNRPLISVEHSHEPEYAANELAGKDNMRLIVAGHDESMELIAIYDNLGKGASGAALQCLNIMTGEDEALSLIV